MEKVKLKVGQTLWVVIPEYRRTSVPSEPVEYQISKIGSKYFELDGYRAKFDIQTLRQATELNYPAQCYLTLQEILDGREQASLTDKVRKAISQYGKSNLSLDQLRKISEIIFPNP
jgi:YesN/AraC family two-component response regulator